MTKAAYRRRDFGWAYSSRGIEDSVTIIVKNMAAGRRGHAGAAADSLHPHPQTGSRVFLNVTNLLKSPDPLPMM